MAEGTNRPGRKLKQAEPDSGDPDPDLHLPETRGPAGWACAWFATFVH